MPFRVSRRPKSGTTCRNSTSVTRRAVRRRSRLSLPVQRDGDSSGSHTRMNWQSLWSESTYRSGTFGSFGERPESYARPSAMTQRSSATKSCQGSDCAWNRGKLHPADTDNIELLTEGAFEAHVVLRRPQYFCFVLHATDTLGPSHDAGSVLLLILMRQHRWVFRALDFRWIIESRHFQGGRLKVWLFEELFAGGTRLAEFMRELGVAIAPSASDKANISVTREAAELMRQRMPADPSSWLQQSSLDHHGSSTTGLRGTGSQRRSTERSGETRRLNHKLSISRLKTSQMPLRKKPTLNLSQLRFNPRHSTESFHCLPESTKSVRNGYNIEFEKHRYFE